ncbi:MAG: efflux RND transporter periplasmic adaptor subunit [Rhizobiales bacterium]|nr:efflux RND transporter periplasmic adaptor subunit [Hyphomicrobiales bacterium]
MNLETLYARRKLILAIVLIIALPAGLYYWTHDGQQGHWGEMPPPLVETEVAAISPVEINVSAIGSLEADQSIVMTAEIAGTITGIDFTDGQKLSKGDEVVTLDSDSLKAKLMQAEARLALAKANHQRAQNLFARGSGTARARDEALNELKSSQADVAAAKSDFDKATISAPFDGTVGLRQISLGQYIEPGDPIVTLADLEHLRIDFRVSEIYLTSVAKGQDVELTFDARPGERFRGLISAIDPVVDADGRALRVRAELDNQEGKLRPGLFGRVNVITLTRNSIVIPEESIIASKSGNSAVFVVGDDLVAHMREVKLGERLPGRVEVLSGLEAGERVIFSGQLKVRDGGKMMPPKAKETADDSSSTQAE